MPPTEDAKARGGRGVGRRRGTGRTQNLDAPHPNHNGVPGPAAFGGGRPTHPGLMVGGGDVVRFSGQAVSDAMARAPYIPPPPPPPPQGFDPQRHSRVGGYHPPPPPPPPLLLRLGLLLLQIATAPDGAANIPTPPASPPAPSRSASSRAARRSNTGSRIPRLAMVRRTRGRNSKKSCPKALAREVNASSASLRSSFTEPSNTLVSGCTTAEAWLASSMRGKSVASERSTVERMCAGTGATPGRNRRTKAGSMRCRCSSTAEPNASSAWSTEGTAEKLPERSASASTAIILGSRSGRCARNSSCNAVANSSHSRSI
mmetsp:Transcript_7579/g.18784  ORF Transcript_7579/g.18784 Transcript_7579/m.18784 type:complete len:316 (-) Transcript_7579:422-1369(-)